MSLRIGSLCTGYGGLDMAVQNVLGGTPAWVSDNDSGASRILAHHYPRVSNLGDLTTVDWQQVEPVDVVCGGYPCQPFSSAGKRKGVADDRHIWPHIARALGVLRPRYAVFENVAGHLSLGFATVLADLAALGFDARWACVRASDIGAPHQRNRLFLVATAADPPHLGHQRGGAPRGGRLGLADHGPAAAHASGEGRTLGQVEPHGPQRPPAERSDREPAADTDSRGQREAVRDLRQGQPDPDWGHYGPAVQRWEAILGRPAPRPTDPLGRLNPPLVEWLMGLPEGHVTDVAGLSRNAQLKALGNGVVPQQAAAALHALMSPGEAAAAA
ncbi:DNA cytosine methyltransferase [Streptomyces virginiae]|uniref:DNA cytosine methyltransferase n=1 Tax=Streptomyces virginiae TaxID=1961 RepID=UPI00325133E1